MQTLHNKVALVTGGSRGIGAAIVKRLAEQGAKVIFTYSNSKDKAEGLTAALKTQGYIVETRQADNAVEGEITKVVDHILLAYGSLDILVNSAGIFSGKSFEQHTMAEYHQTMAINVAAVMEACIAAANHMSGGGRIITIGSGLADRIPFAGATLYTMSKSALIGLTKGLARDLGAKGITVNLLQPGSVDTDMNPAQGDFADFQRSFMAVPKYGKPEQIAGMVAYLASDEAAYASGAVFTLDGGANS